MCSQSSEDLKTSTGVEDETPGLSVYTLSSGSHSQTLDHEKKENTAHHGFEESHSDSIINVFFLQYFVAGSFLPQLNR